MNDLKTYKATFIKICDYYEDRCNNLGGPFYLLSATTIDKDSITIKNGEDKKYYNEEEKIVKKILFGI